MNKKIIRNLNIAKGILSIVFIVAVVTVSHSFAPNAFAQGVVGRIVIPPRNNLNNLAILSAVEPLHGFAWSDMPDGSDQNLVPTDQEAGRGFGWISMNGSDTGVSGNYSVSLNTGNGTFSGYAWSEMGGWVDFAPSGPYPSSGTLNLLPTTPASISASCISSHLTNCPVTGWIRFVAGEDTNTADTGGWDGWVNMSGSNFGVTFNASTGQFSGYAWGGMDAGWINFTGVSITPPAPIPPNDCPDVNATNYGQPLPCEYPPGYCNDPTATNYGQVGTCTSNTPTLSPFILNKNCPTDGSNGTVTLHWSTTGIASCTASTSGYGSGFSGSVPVQGPVTVSGIPANGMPNNFTIVCTALQGYVPTSLTESTSAMCPDVTTGTGTGTGTPVEPHPIYKEN